MVSSMRSCSVKSKEKIKSKIKRLYVNHKNLSIKIMNMNKY